MRIHTRMRLLLAIPVAFCSLLAGGAVRRAQDVCGPFTDVSPAFCPYVLEMYYLGITAGTSATTYSPDNPVTRGQAAVFISKGVNQAIARSSRRAALGQWWTTTPHWDVGLGVTTVGDTPSSPQSDGADVWVPNYEGTISRVRASDGALLGTWTGAASPFAALVAMGKVFIAGQTIPGKLYQIDPDASPGGVVTVADTLGEQPNSIAFDGSRIWTANIGGVIIPPAVSTPSISILTPGTWEVETLTTGFRVPYGLVFDGKEMWVTDVSDGRLLRLDAAGSVTQAVDVGSGPRFPVFDGENIWVPNSSSASVSIVRASTGEVIATLTGNGLEDPATAAFDGERVLVTSPASNRISLWRAADLLPLGTFQAPPSSVPFGACSDGIHFWVTLLGSNQLARF